MHGDDHSLWEQPQLSQAGWETTKKAGRPNRDSVSFGVRGESLVRESARTATAAFWASTDHPSREQAESHSSEYYAQRMQAASGSAYDPSS